MKLSIKQILLFSFILASYTFGLNEYNNLLIRQQNPDNVTANARSLVNNHTVYSIDNVWYLSQVKNLINGKGFTIDEKKYNYTVRRTPIYPVFYGLHYILFGEKDSYFYIRFSQILIYILATFALLFAAFNFTNNKKIAFIAAILYGFNPSLASFLYYTITEALSSSLVCFILYFLSCCKKYNRPKDWLLAGIFFAFGSLSRPTLFFFSLSIFFFILFQHRKSFRNILISGLIFAGGAGILFIPNTIRNYILTKDFILLEKYYGDPMEYGLPNMELRGWISCWMNPADYSSEIISNNMMDAVLTDSVISKKSTIDREMQRLPKNGLLVNNINDVRTAYESLYDYYYTKVNAADKDSIPAAEKASQYKIKKLREEFIQKAPFRYYIITPILIIKSVIMQSNAAQLVFLDNYRDNKLKYAFKLLLYLFNIYLFIALAGCLFFIRKYTEVYGIVLLFVLANFAYITFGIKYFEVRYLIPLFPCLYITGALFFVEIYTKLKQRLHL